MSIPQQGTLAQRPVGPLPIGYDYAAVDTGQWFTWNGGAWEEMLAGGTELDSYDGDTTFGPVTGGTGLSGVPVTDAVVTVPDISRPVNVDAQGVFRIQTTDGPAFVFTLLAAAGAVDISINTALSFAPMYMPIVGNATIIEAYFTIRARIPPNTPSDVQLYIGGHDNTTPPAFFTPIPVNLIVAGPHGHYKMSATIA